MNRREFVKQTAALGVAVGTGVYASGLGRSAAPAGTQPLRPPGALPEDDFLSTCIRCLRCVDACPNHALTSLPQGAAGGGTPTLHMRRASAKPGGVHPGAHGHSQRGGLLDEFAAVHGSQRPDSVPAATLLR